MTKNNDEPTTIYIVRHGESESNVYAQENPDKPASHFGELGAPLTEKGRQQALDVAQKIRNIPFAAVFSSDLSRARETAEIIAQEQELHVNTNNTIRERYFGDDMSSVQKREIEKALEDLNEEEKFAFKYYPHGESGYDVINRFKKFLHEIIPVYRGKTIVVVSHGYVMRSFLIHVGFAKFDELRGGTIDNAGYFVVNADGKNFTISETHGIHKNEGNDNEE